MLPSQQPILHFSLLVERSWVSTAQVVGSGASVAAELVGVPVEAAVFEVVGIDGSREGAGMLLSAGEDARMLLSAWEGAGMLPSVGEGAWMLFSAFSIGRSTILEAACGKSDRGCGITRVLCTADTPPSFRHVEQLSVSPSNGR